MAEIYVPLLDILDGKKATWKLKYGPVAKKYFWFKYPHELSFRQDLSIVLFCSFDFSHFPFETNACDLKFASASTTAGSLSLSRAKIMNEQSEPGIGSLILKSHQTKLPFDITMQSLESFNQTIIDYSYPVCGMRLFFHRKSLGTLLGSFYGPTGVFALLSTVSYTIDPGMVPGRLGLLVTLYLIATNVYNSVNAPKARGFSYIEIWMVGMQIPILAAIIEYGIILGMKKRQSYQDIVKRSSRAQSWIQDQSAKDFEIVTTKMDSACFIGSITFTILFTTLYVIFF